MSYPKNIIRLSPTSGLNLYRDCPRCFWLAYNEKVHRPRGIFPSLPGGIDLVVKDYFDKYRGFLPPELEGKIEGQLMPDTALMNRWRNWRTGLVYKDDNLNAELFGALDDCLVYDGKYVPLDYKTRASAPKEGDSEKYYQTQLDSYSLLLKASGYEPADFAYLIYYFPVQVLKKNMIKFEIKPVKVATDTERVKELFENAVNFLKQPLPAHHSGSACEY